MKDNSFLLIGTYTDGESDGIYVYKYDPEKNEFVKHSLAKVDNPSYMTLSDDKKFVYAASESEKELSCATAFSFDYEQGRLNLLNQKHTQGEAPVYVVVSPDGKYVITGNYGEGSITVFSREENGELGDVVQFIQFEGKNTTGDARQEKSHVHCVCFTPDNKYLLVTDLGLDKIYQFRVEPCGTDSFLEENPQIYNVTKFSGPRHLLFHRNGKYLYLINELSETLMVFSYQNEKLERRQTIQLDSSSSTGGADIVMSSDAKYLYASNRRQNDGIHIFGINETNGLLKKIDYEPTGFHPRNIFLSKNDKYLYVANKDSNNIEIFERNSVDGKLSLTNITIDIDSPVFVMEI